MMLLIININKAREALLFNMMLFIINMIIDRKVLLFTMMLFITDCGIKRGAGAGGGGHEAESSSNLLGKPRGRGGPCELYFVIVFSREEPLQWREGSCTVCLGSPGPRSRLLLASLMLALLA